MVSSDFGLIREGPWQTPKRVNESSAQQKRGPATSAGPQLSCVSSLSVRLDAVVHGFVAVHAAYSVVHLVQHPCCSFDRAALLPLQVEHHSVAIAAHVVRRVP